MQTEIHFIPIAPAYIKVIYIAIATLNTYACSLPAMANVNWHAFPQCFLPTM